MTNRNDGALFVCYESHSMLSWHIGVVHCAHMLG